MENNKPKLVRTGNKLAKRTKEGKLEKGTPSLNPMGRPKGSVDWQTDLKRILDLMRNKENGKTLTDDDILTKYVQRAFGGNDKILTELIERKYGKIAQAINVSGSLETKLSEEENVKLDIMLKKINKLS